MTLRAVSLTDRFTATDGHQVINGSQALVLALIRQRRFDRARGLETAGFLSGYRGSPLASLDAEAWKAERFLDEANVRFVPGINEDLAMTACAGTQHVALDPKATVEGVFAMWYGKGAGLDRTGDALRHAHGAGASRLGGVLCVVGDDHALKSSSQAYHSEPTFIDMQMPVLAPSNIQEMLDYAHIGWEMSRYSGCYVGLKVLAEHVNATEVVDVVLERAALRLPEPLPEENDRWIRWPDPWSDVEKRLLEVKLPAALEFARANGVNRVMARARTPKLGIVTAGKSFADVVQALGLVGLGLDDAAAVGISVYKIGMPWPVDEAALRDFCAAHEAVLVVEEKRDLLETQVRSALYGTLGPVVVGRRARDGSPQFSQVGELGALDVLRALVREAGALLPETARVAADRMLNANLPDLRGGPARTPYFCSGCPHNTSTVVPDGSRALAGVGCHFMATGMDRDTGTLPQMGGEGASWIGTAPFTETGHVFVNLGEGTYYHSGLLAIRAAVAAGVNATYKILFNDAIAMTGGQPVEGELTVPIIAAQLRAEGVEHVEILAEDPAPYRDGRLTAPKGVAVHGRDDSDAVQKRLRDVPGVSALIFDQVCATEKRRRRKRGTMEKATERVLINPRVCEGCGDCSVKSNCMSVVPVETEFGRKRAIDQFSCNQDMSCVKGFCPSFVTVSGGSTKTRAHVTIDGADLPRPETPDLAMGTSFNIVCAGVGGTGIVTVGALLGMAAHLEGKRFSIYDKLGMAQKYGAVNSHLRIGTGEADLAGIRIPDGQVHLMIGGDLGVAAETANLAGLGANGAAVVATEQAASGAFVLDPDLDFGTTLARANISKVAGVRAEFVPARELAMTVLGDEVGANLLLVGYAWQKGLIPLSEEAILKAVEMNGVAVDLNLSAFHLGRRYAHDPEAYAKTTEDNVRTPDRMSWQELREHRAAMLTDYQNARYARRYEAVVDRVADAEARVMGEAGALAHAVAQGLAKLMAYKDEYEVGRLYSNGAFQAQLEATFGAGAKPAFHLAPPLLGGTDPRTGAPRKRRFGPGMMRVFGLLARLKHLRGTPLDPFGFTAERRMERALIAEYESDLDGMLDRLTSQTHAAVVARARLPEDIRGYGHIKEASVEAARKRRDQLLGEIDRTAGAAAVPAAAE